MRFKRLNIEERSKKYSDAQKSSLNNISSNINKIGEFFDVIVELEQFVIKNIRPELIDFFKILENRDSLISEHGKDAYIDEIFIPVAEKLETSLYSAEDNWNSSRKDYNIDMIKESIEHLKAFNRALQDLLNSTESKVETFIAINEIFKSFGNFVVYKSIVSDNRAEKIENLLHLKEEITDIDNVIDKAKKGERKTKLTIDDL